MAVADRTRAHSLERGARRLLLANTRRRELAGRSGRFAVPSAGRYPFQWFWDSCFHAIVWSRWDWRRAADELDALFAWQRPDGFIPHVVFWDQRRISLWKWWHYMESVGTPRHKPRTTEQMQPPVLALAVERVVEAGGGAGYLRRVLPQLVAYHDHLAAERDPDGDGLISVISQFETGLDFSPVWRGGGRRALKGPVVFARLRRPQIPARLHRYDLQRVFAGDLHQESVFVNAIYGRALRTLARLARLVEEPDVAARADERAARVTEALLAKCVGPDGLFHDLVGRDERRTLVKTISALLPLLLEDLPFEHADRLVATLTDPRRFWPAYPVPSVALDEPTFSRDSRLWRIRLIWRGPLSMNTNWLLARALAERGYEEPAQTIGERSRELVARHGFNEFYDPLDGSPVGEPEFGWATLAADMP